MKIFYCCSVVSILVQVSRSAELYCRDNENKPVEWWFLYKPPFDAAPKLDLGRNFSFITSSTAGRWKPSKKYINSNSMLLHTLAPLYMTKYADDLAVVAYSNRDNSGITEGTSAHGLMMADESGGIWMGHTVPGLLEFAEDRPSFPSHELLNGHLIMCLSLDLPTLNLVAESIREVAPEVVRMRVPPSVRYLLPDWQYFNRPVMRAQNSEPLPLSLDFFTTAKTIRAVLLFRRPGDKRCLYRTFAKAKGIILDVYGHDKRTRSACESSYGVRNIESISLKYPENIYYIDNKTDRINFAVSTAAHWQRIGDGPRQYWTCISSMEREDSTKKGGIVVCVEDYSIWWSFDNMKIREPKC